MRIRLLMDVTVDETEVPDLAELIVNQPSSLINIEGFHPLGARFMGAQTVFQAEEVAYGS